MQLSHLSLADWKQFQNIEIDFHPSLTVLTGANGAGKTTILNILNRHFGWSVSNLSTPLKKKGGGIEWATGFFSKIFKLDDARQIAIGKILYSDKSSSRITIPPNGSTQYGVNIDSPGNINGLHIPSHRPLFSYQYIPHIPTNMGSAGALLNSYQHHVRNTPFANGRKSLKRGFGFSYNIWIWKPGL